MWQDRLLHCVVFTKTSEEFAPHYLAEIRHDMRQTTLAPSHIDLDVGAFLPVAPQNALGEKKPQR